MSGTSTGSAVFDVSAFLDRPKFGAHRILIFALCTLVMTVDGYDVFVVGYLVPALAQDFGVPLPAVTSIFVFQTIGLGLGAYAVSPFADRFGRRNIILVCTALLGLLTLAGTLATSVGELAVLRFAASFFFGAVVQNLFSTAHHAADVGAYLHVVLAPRLGGKHRVVTDHVVDFEFGQIKS